ncbi:MAG: DUF4440 domain-containing protein [Aliishimia sp.]
MVEINETKTQADLLNDLEAHERRVWDALVSGDATADAALLAADFLGVYSDGFASRAEHAGQLVEGPSVLHYDVSDIRARALGPEHAVLSYQAEFQRVGRDDIEVMFVSSIWQRHAAGWINILSQDTPFISA